ncbi:hypothetical protein [Ignavibacterium album]|uniref:hypothetical protein n=1 Tax=Ignavibacterium album TaxID=591197 RepID=UPI0038B30B0E
MQSVKKEKNDESSFNDNINFRIEFDGRELSSGIYFYSIEAGDFKSAKKMLLMK